MTVDEKISQYLQKLPPSLQTEVLDFIEYILSKVARQEEQDWSSMSLSFAMRGMEGEDSPTYTLSDLKVVFG